MLSDIVINISNGFEDTSDVIKDVFSNNNYDAVIKYGTDEHPQNIEYKSMNINLCVIPTPIIYNKPCLIGFGDELNLELLNKEIDVLKKLNIDISRLLYIEESTLIENIKLINLKSSRVQKYINCIFNRISLSEFTQKFNNICYISLKGQFKRNGNTYENTTPNSLSIFSICNPRNINNIIGFKDVIESHTGYGTDNDTTLYKIVEKNKLQLIGNKTIINNILLNYYWIDLDKIINIIHSTGINIIYFTGSNLINNMKIMYIIKDKKKLIFNCRERFCRYIISTLKENTYINIINFI